MELYVFDRRLNFIGIIDSFISFRWTRKYNKNGEFELQCALTSEKIQLLQKENIIYKKGDSEAGYIQYRKLKRDSEGKEILVINGLFLTGYLNRRIIWGDKVLNDTVENVMRTLVHENCINPTNINRIIDNLILGDLKNGTQIINYQVSYKNLNDELEALSTMYDLGFRVKLNIEDKKLTFDIYSGINKSVDQTVNPRVVFSEEFDNVLDQEFTDSLTHYKNLVLVSGIGDDDVNKFITVGDSSGLDRFEMFADQGSLSDEIDGDFMGDAEYNELLKSKGDEALSQNRENETFDNKININSNLVYKVDFDLGDIVTCISRKWDITLNSRITEIEEVYEEQGMQVNATFGNNIPTIIDKIKNISKQNAGKISNNNTNIFTNVDGGSFV